MKRLSKNYTIIKFRFGRKYKNRLCSCHEISASNVRKSPH